MPATCLFVTSTRSDLLLSDNQSTAPFGWTRRQEIMGCGTPVASQLMSKEEPNLSRILPLGYEVTVGGTESK